MKVQSDNFFSNTKYFEEIHDDDTVSASTVIGTGQTGQVHHWQRQR